MLREPRLRVWERHLPWKPGDAQHDHPHCSVEMLEATACDWRWLIAVYEGYTGKLASMHRNERTRAMLPHWNERTLAMLLHHEGMWAMLLHREGMWAMLLHYEGTPAMLLHREGNMATPHQDVEN